MEERISRCSCW